jgi:hypothetical protein
MRPQTLDRRERPWAEASFARREPMVWRTGRGVKEGAHGGTLGSPVLFAVEQ